jgi:hypothetical protein
MAEWLTGLSPPSHIAAKTWRRFFSVAAVVVMACPLSGSAD